MGLYGRNGRLNLEFFLIFKVVFMNICQKVLPGSRFLVKYNDRGSIELRDQISK